MRHFPHFVEGIYTLFDQNVQDLWVNVPQNELIAEDGSYAPTTNDTMWEVLIFDFIEDANYVSLINGYANENGTSDYFNVGLLPIMSQMFSSENDSVCTETVDGNSQPCIVSIDGQRYYTRAGLIRLQRVVSNILNTRNTWSSRTTNALLAAASSPIADKIGQMTGANVTGNGLLNWNDNNENVPGTELFTGAATTGCEPQIGFKFEKTPDLFQDWDAQHMYFGVENTVEAGGVSVTANLGTTLKGRLGIEANVSTSYIHGKPEPQIKGGLEFDLKLSASYFGVSADELNADAVIINSKLSTSFFTGWHQRISRSILKASCSFAGHRLTLNLKSQSHLCGCLFLKRLI